MIRCVSFRSIALAILFLLAAVAPSAAQFESASVLGTIRDASRSLVPGATVVLTSLDTGIVVSTVTDGDANYQFLNVKLGNYEATASLTGFQTSRVSRFTVTVGARQRVDFVLEVGSVEATVEVQGRAASVLETDSSDRGQLINQKQVVELPLNGRAYSDLALLSTGVVKTASASGGLLAREGSFSVNGLRSTYNNFLLDGVDNNYYGTSNQGFSNQVVQVSPDAVAEFKVVTNNMSAEFGRAGGAAINTALKSGTNELHGAGWEFMRDTALNAVGFFKPALGRKPTLERHQFGATLGGPVVRNRTFFFVDYEGFREKVASVAFATLPSADQRLGILGVPIRNPFTGEVYADGRIPASAIIPFARKVFDDLPATTSAAAANNFTTLNEATTDRDKANLKIDHQFGSALRGFARYSQSRADIFQNGVIPGPSGSEGNGFTRIPIIQVAGGVTYTPTPNSMVEVRMGFSRARSGKEPPLIGGPSPLELYGLVGLPTDRSLTGGLPVQVFNGGLSALGRQATNPQYQYPTLWNPKVNVTRIMGRHAVKVGVEHQALNVDHLDVNPILGRDVYTAAFSRPAGGTAPLSVYSIADFLMGARNSYSLVNADVAHSRQRMWFGYVQDDIRASSKLTINLGLRYEYATPIYERDNRLSNFDPVTQTLKFAKDGSIEDRALVKPDRNNFGPRIGAAYSVNDKTVVRGGYGVSYVHFNRTGTSYLSLNAPFFILGLVEQTPGPGFRNTQQGYPSGFTDAANFDPLRTTIQAVTPDSPSGMVQSWYLSAQREIGRGFLVDVGYIGNTAKNLLIINDQNEARPNRPGENVPLQDRRPIPGFASISTAFPLGVSDYRGLQVKIEKRATGGLYLLNSFTWSRSTDNASQPLDSPAGDGPSVQSIYNPNADKGRSANDLPFVNVTSVVWDLPFGRGRRFLSNMGGVGEAFLGGWQVTAINNAVSGRTINLVYNNGGAFTVIPGLAVFGRPAYRPNLSGDPLTPEAERGPNNYLNRATVSAPTDVSQPFGNAPRNAARGYPFHQLDLGLFKNFELPGNTRLQLRAEAFNALNRTNFGAPDANISSPGFGTIRSTFDPRQIQLGVKLLF